MASKIPYEKLVQAMNNLYGFVNRERFYDIVRHYHPRATKESCYAAVEHYAFENGDLLYFTINVDGYMYAIDSYADDPDAYETFLEEMSEFGYYLPETEEEFLSYYESSDDDPVPYIKPSVLNDFRTFLKYAIKKPSDFNRIYLDTLMEASDLDYEDFLEEEGKIPLSKEQMKIFAQHYQNLKLYTRTPGNHGFYPIEVGMMKAEKAKKLLAEEKKPFAVENLESDKPKFELPPFLKNLK